MEPSPQALFVTSAQTSIPQKKAGYFQAVGYNNQQLLGTQQFIRIFLLRDGTAWEQTRGSWG
jgi:hypothetical protein